MTTAVIAATSSTASTMWMFTSTIGRPARACQSPTTICATSTASRSPVHSRRRRPGECARADDENERAREQRVGRPRVDVLHELRVQPVARRAAVAGVRTGAGHEDADDDGDQHEGARDVRDDRVPARHGTRRGPGTA